MEKSFYAPQAFREKDAGPNQCFGIEVVPGRRCDLNCQACYKRTQKVTRARISFYSRQADTQDSGSDTPIDDVLDYVAQAKGVGFREAALLGGEPTLRKDIREIIQGVRQQGLSPILVTSGAHIDQPLVDTLSATRSVVVTHASIPGRPELVNHLAGTTRDYAKILAESIEKLREADGIQLVLEMPLTMSVYDEAFDFFCDCRENGIMPFIEISRRNDDGKPTTSVTPEQVAELFEQCRAFDVLNYPELAAPAVHPPAYGNPCTMSITGLHVKNNDNGDYGGVYSCCAQHLRHGDLKEQSLEEILKSPTLAVYRDQDAYIVGPCRDCELYDVCKGGCRGEAFLRFGCPRASSPACHRIPPEVRNNPNIMAPQSCEGCPAEHAEGCSLLHTQ
ncbi:hypothetical protein COU80_01965 [Candidatus Peregrinibacteria bacterium CG10_big_fil_rev_8_21_14_0_10_55_24]|nr:MAG: hypothetical protein COU80_01965 [Candidatus Peregrinibacteria bacterium CG10_big_fil_rev_8_21_14_0_10_55_24]